MVLWTQALRCPHRRPAGSWPATPARRSAACRENDFGPYFTSVGMGTVRAKPPNVGSTSTGKSSCRSPQYACAAGRGECCDGSGEPVVRQREYRI